jgi:transposase-like protein
VQFAPPAFAPIAPSKARKPRDAAETIGTSAVAGDMTTMSKGISTGDFEEALAALLGKDAAGLSSSTVGRLKDAWSEEHARWSRRDLGTKRYVYFWADGIHVQARLEDAAQCLLVIIGATPEGKKELVSLIDGVRESAQSWRELLLDLKRRGLAIAPELAVADGALGRHLERSYY